MSNLFIATPFLNDAATLTYSDEDTSYPGANLLRQQPRDFFRSSGNSDFYIVGDLGANYLPNVIALLYSNADSSTMWRIRLATSEANLTNGSAVYDSGTISHWPTTGLDTWNRTHALHFISSANVVSARWYRIDISGLSALSYYEAGRLMVDAAYNPARAANIGLAMGREDQSIIAMTPAATYTRQRPQKRTLSMGLQYRDEDETYDNIMDIYRRCGTHKEVLVCHDASSRVMERLLYARMRSLQDVAHKGYLPEFSGGAQDSDFDFQEFEHP